MIISHFASQLRCAYCNQINKTEVWPKNGDYIPFYYQTKERTEVEPGRFNIQVHCPFCEKDWFVVWDDDPQ